MDEHKYALQDCNTYAKYAFTAHITGLWASSLFLTITVISYLILWSTHKLVGILQFFFVLCSAIHFITLVITNTDRRMFLPKEFYKPTRILLRIFFLSSSFWLTCLNIETWRTFRNFRQLVKTNSLPSNTRQRFTLYFLLSFGFPSLLAVLNNFFQLDDEDDPSTGSMSFDERCARFFNAKGSMYFYIPFSILHIFDFFLFLWTWRSISNIKRDVSILSSTENVGCLNLQLEGFSIFLKLFVTMGIAFTLDGVAWVISMIYYSSSFEVTEYAMPTIVLFSFQGVGVFYILLCNKSTLINLEKKVNFPKKEYDSTNSTIGKNIQGWIGYVFACFLYPIIYLFYTKCGLNSQQTL